MVSLIIDSGSSRSTWVVIDDRVIDNQELSGINPTAMPASVDIIKTYNCRHTTLIEKVFYYGSGVSNPQKAEQIKQLLSQKFPKAKIEVVSDILAACRSHGHTKAGIVSILGTGVNTVLYDGQKIVKSITSLGYLIDEEGSGYNIGRLIVKKYLRSAMNKIDEALFERTYEMSPNDLIQCIYRHPQANYHIASYSKFLNISSMVFRNQILKENFSAYTLNHIQKIDNYRDYNINFVGSIAYVFRKELKEEMDRIGATIGHIAQSPIEGLIKYHINK